MEAESSGDKKPGAWYGNLSALQIAIHDGQLELLTRLLNSGANPNVKPNSMNKAINQCLANFRDPNWFMDDLRNWETKIKGDKFCFDAIGALSAHQQQDENILHFFVRSLSITMRHVIH